MARELWDNPLIICGISSLPAPGIRATTLRSYIQGIPRTVSATGTQELHAIGHLALLGGLFVAAVPLLVLACTYLPWRLRPPR